MVDARQVIVNAIVYVNRTGCAWRCLPNDFPPWRHIAVDATGLVLAVVIITASVQDRDADRPCCGTCPAAAPAATSGGPKATRSWSAGHGRPDNPAPRHPEAVTTKSTIHLDAS